MRASAGVNGMESHSPYAEVMSPAETSLAEQQRRLIEIAATARALVSVRGDEADWNAIRHLRGVMVETLASYQLVVHRLLAETEPGDADREKRDRACFVKVETIALVKEYGDFTARWAQRKAAAHWPEYRLSALRMINAFTDHVRVTAAADIAA